VRNNAAEAKNGPSRRAVTEGNACGAPEMEPYSVARRSFGFTKLFSSRLAWFYFRQQRNIRILC
jgi:hypothetical protein